jgi:hypothetical protein
MEWHKRKPNAALKMHTRGMGHHPPMGLLFMCSAPD